MNAIAFDRSARRIDADGRLHVADCKISAARVNPYRGSELPNWEALGLDADKVYQLYRTPEALAEGAASFENLPLMMQHVETSAASPKQELTVGVVTNVRFQDPFLIGDLAVWTADAIRGIEDGTRRDLSCGYRFEIVRDSGTVDGVAYDFKITRIVGNHLALCPDARVGDDIQVADSQEILMHPLTARVVSRLTPYLAPTADRKALAVALDSVVLERAAEEESERDKQRGFYDKTADEWQAMSAADRTKARDEWSMNRTARDLDHRKDFASDSATVRKQILDAVVARDAVRPVVGVIALDAKGMDTAESIYRFALKQLGVPTKDVHPSALAGLYAAHAKSRERPVFDSARGVISEHSVASIWK